MNTWPAMKNPRTQSVTAIVISMIGLLLLLFCFTACTTPPSPTKPEAVSPTKPEVASPAKPGVTASEVTVPSVAGSRLRIWRRQCLANTVSRLSARMRSIATP